MRSAVAPTLAAGFLLACTGPEPVSEADAAACIDASPPTRVTSGANPLCSPSAPDRMSGCLARCSFAQCPLSLPKPTTDTLTLEPVEWLPGLVVGGALHDGALQPIRPGLTGQYVVGGAVRIGPPATSQSFSVRRTYSVDCEAFDHKIDWIPKAKPAAQADGSKVAFSESILIAGNTANAIASCGKCLRVGFEVTDLATGARGVTAVGLQLTYPDAASPTTP